MVRPGYVLTRNEASDLFLLLSHARLKLNGKMKTMANNYWEKFEEALGLKPTYDEKDKIETKNT